MVGLAWLLRGRIGRGPLAALLFFGGTLLPAIGFLDVYPMRYSYVADHFQYLASLGPIAGGITGLFQGWGVDTSEWSRAMLQHGQVKPEHLINLNAFGIIVGQVAIAYMVRKLKPLTCIILGSFITVVSFLFYLIGQGGWIMVFSISTRLDLWSTHNTLPVLPFSLPETT